MEFSSSSTNHDGSPITTKEPQRLNTLRDTYKGKGKGKARLKDDGGASSLGRNEDATDMDLDPLHYDEDWDSRVAELLQAQECLSGDDLVLVQDMLLAEILAASEKVRAKVDRALALDLDEMTRKRVRADVLNQMALPCATPEVLSELLGSSVEAKPSARVASGEPLTTTAAASSSSASAFASSSTSSASASASSANPFASSTSTFPDADTSFCSDSGIASTAGDCSICFENVQISLGPAGMHDCESSFVGNISDFLNDGSKGSGMEHKRGLQFPGCEHVYCQGCFEKWISAASADWSMSVPLTCAYTDCKERLEPGDLLKAVLPDAVFNKYLERHLRASGRAIHCPFKSCGKLVTVAAPSKDGEDATVNCPGCKQAVCFNCRVPAHAGYTCAQYSALPEGERDPEDLALFRLAGEQKWQRCPACRAMVDRTEGCNHITCHCGREFCYHCGGAYHLGARAKCRCQLFHVPPEPALQHR